MTTRRRRLILTDADRFPLQPEHVAWLDQEQIDLIEVPSGTSESEYIQICKQVDGLLVYATKITRPIIEAMERCQIVARCGIGYDNIDVKAASEKGILVTYVSDYCVEEVSDHTIGLLLDAVRRISLGKEKARAGSWGSYQQLGKIRRLTGQKVGLVGFGKIAKATARKLSSFHVELAAYDPNISEEVMTSLQVRKESFQQLITTSDIVVLIVPLTPETRYMMNRKVFEQMKQGVILINTARGALVEEDALLWALQAGIVQAAALDVLEQVPPGKDHPLLSLPQVTVTPHSAAFSEEALKDLAQRAIEDTLLVFNGQPPRMQVPEQRSSTKAVK